ncbi:MAG: hypothetical protein C0614_12160 [Desulfuromonas sp.]|nr:MAG: hypothetical protein C0614_12160 [Desulfuromonas sp.]
MFRYFSITVVFLTLLAQVASAALYKVDPVHSQLLFTADHLMIFKVTGSFNDFNGEIEADAATKSLSSASATVEVKSIDTREQMRDAHLLSADFFDAANHPQMTFVSKRIEGKGDQITVYADLTIRGTTREVPFRGSFRGEQADPWGKVRAGFTASAVINRHDFGLKWNKALETGGFVVGDLIAIDLEVQAIRAK